MIVHECTKSVAIIIAGLIIAYSSPRTTVPAGTMHAPTRQYAKGSRAADLACRDIAPASYVSSLRSVLSVAQSAFRSTVSHQTDRVVALSADKWSRAVPNTKLLVLHFARFYASTHHKVIRSPKASRADALRLTLACRLYTDRPVFLGHGLTLGGIRVVYEIHNDRKHLELVIRHEVCHSPSPSTLACAR
jgi:hypothetical protein